MTAIAACHKSLKRQSQYSLASTLGARLSIASGANLDDNHVIDEMLHRIGSHRGSVRVDRPNIPPRKPDSWLGKAKYYYDKFNLRYVAPFGLLLVYSIVGAFIFYWVEYENEQEMLRQEALILERLRNETFHRLKEVITDRIRSDQTKLYNSRDVLVWYEKQLAKLHLPEGLEWDMWGALFYVGTLFTTIGYGNIAPRTTFGQALSIMYAIVGIPLVLAILNQFGKTLTKFLSSLWIKYRQCIKAFTKRKRIASKMRTSRIWGERLRQKQDERDLLTVEEGGVGNVPQTNHSLLNNPNLQDDFLDDELLESRTIPVWLALFLCVAWICACAGLFCLWETRWSYFTSLYFFFISLSTIGLGDVVPDHPHMLILMFWLVIIGLSIVSMLLSVIQIKIEEWLYHLMIRMRKEYQRALANGDPVERQAILNKLMKKEPWFMRNMAQHLISENQAAELDHQAETFERSVCQVNNKNIQTEPPNLIDSIIEQSDNETQLSQQQQFNNMSTDAASLASELITSPLQADMSTQWSVNTDMRSESRTLDMPRLESALPLSNMVWQSQDTLESFSDAISDATSPCKSIIEAVDKSMQVSAISCLDRSQQFDPLPASVCGVQTDIAQFQVDEIMLRLHEIQEKSKKKPMLMDRSMETSLQQFDAKDESGEENDKTEQISQSTQYDIAPVVVDISITADLNSQMVEEGTETEQNECLLNRSMETDAWMAQLQMPECSRSVQTHFDEDEVVELDELATKRTTSKQQVRIFDDNVNERSTQCEPQIKDTCDTCMQTMLEMCDFDSDSSARARSSSLVSLRGSTDTEEPAPVAKQDLIIQTDDSYLKIARRLDQIRNNRTASLHICAAKPLRFPQDDDPSNSNRQRSENLILFNEQPSERREFNVDPTRRKSLRRGADKPMRSPKSPIWPGKVVSFSMDSDAATIEEGPSNLSDSDTLQPRTDVS